MIYPLTDLTGRVFARLVVLGRVTRPGRGGVWWACQCDCGNFHVAEGKQLKRGKTRSCGCYKNESVGDRFRKAGPHEWKTTEYRIYHGMVQRCHNPKCKSYRWYGAKGRVVCDRWRYGDGEMSGYQCFVADMGRRPDTTLSIDRINNHGGYAPDNCRWATVHQQAQNRG